MNTNDFGRFLRGYTIYTSGRAKRIINYGFLKC